MSAFPAGVTGAITQALWFSLARNQRMFGADNMSSADLPVDTVKALKWVHSVDPKTAESVARRALENAADVTDPDPVLLKNGALSLRHSLTQGSDPYGSWSLDQADTFIASVLADA